MRRAAHIHDGMVANVSVVTDGPRGDQIIASRGLVEIPADSPAGIGWDYDGETFTDNRPVEPQPQPEPDPEISDDVAALARLLDVDPETIKTEMSRSANAKT